MRCFLIFLVLAVSSSLTANAQSINIFIEGSAATEEQRELMMEAFRQETTSYGCTAVDSEDDADYTFIFDVEPYDQEPPSEYIISMTLVRNADDVEIVSLDYSFADFDELHEYCQFLLYQAIVLIPKPKEVEIIKEVEIVVEPVYETVIETQIREKFIPVPENNDWRNKWLYARISLDYPVTFFRLRGDGLIGGIGVYEGTYASPTRVSPLDNRYVAMPGFTAGAEAQFLDWLSTELNCQLSLGRPGFNMFPNFALGAQLKFPLKFIKNFMIEPYGAFSFMLNKSPVFEKFPRAALGGGAQVNIKGGDRGAFFVDLNYMYSLGDVLMYNTYEALYPNPNVIHYRRFALGFGAGYKIGFFNRKQ